MNKLRIVYWPNGTWVLEEEAEEFYSFLGDDCGTITVPYDFSYDDIQKAVDKSIGE